MEANKLEFNQGYDRDLEHMNEFKITSLNGVAWALRRIKRAEAEYEEVEKYAKLEMEALKRFLEEEKQRLEGTKAHMSFYIEEYLMEKRKDNPKAILRTTAGTVSTRKATTWEYDEPTLLKFLKDREMTDYIRVKEEVNKADLKKAMEVSDGGVVTTADGEIVEGVEVKMIEKLAIKLADGKGGGENDRGY